MVTASGQERDSSKQNDIHSVCKTIIIIFPAVGYIESGICRCKTAHRSLKREAIVCLCNLLYKFLFVYGCEETDFISGEEGGSGIFSTWEFTRTNRGRGSDQVGKKCARSWSVNLVEVFSGYARMMVTRTLWKSPVVNLAYVLLSEASKYLTCREKRMVGKLISYLQINSAFPIVNHRPLVSS